MFLRLWAILLITICGLNAFVVGDEFSFTSTPDNTEIAATHNIEQSSFDSINQSHDQHHDKDCGDQHQNCHQCHLGHCTFILANSSVSLPDAMTSRIGADTDSYTSVDLSTLQRPPLA